MPFVRNNHDFGARSGTGLAITVVIHAGLAALALTASGVVELPTIYVPPKPIVVDLTREKPEDSPQPIEPRIVEEDFPITVIDPVIDVAVIENPPIVAPPTPFPPVGDTGSRPPSTDIGPPAHVPPTAPVMVAARIDPRHAASLQPVYPEASKRLDEEGIVILRVLIGTDGRVKQAEVGTSSGYDRLDQAALRQARRAWQFLPATRDGVAIESWKELPIRFELKNG